MVQLFHNDVSAIFVFFSISKLAKIKWQMFDGIKDGLNVKHDK